MTSCRLGAPVFMSFPHFYDADPFFLEQVGGMSPKKDNHQFSMTLEPVSATSMCLKHFKEFLKFLVSENLITSRNQRKISAQRAVEPN